MRPSEHKERNRARYERKRSLSRAPLKRYLRSCVGQPWSKVYAALAPRLGRATYKQRLELLQLRRLVRVHVWEENGALRGADLYGRVETLQRGYAEEFFVCPKTGLLRRLDPVPLPARAPKGDQDVRLVDAWHQLRKVDGAWFEVTLAPLPEDRKRRHCYDVLVRRRILPGYDTELWNLYGRGDCYACFKRQLSRKEIAARIS